MLWVLFVGFLPGKLQASASQPGGTLLPAAAGVPGQSAAKLHMHTDRTFYVPGDTVWYKAYLADAATLQPVKQRTIVTVAVYNAARQQVCSQKIQTKQGTAAAQLVLPDSLRTGNYALVAYAGPVKEERERTLFQKTLVVLRPGKPAGPAKIPASEQELAALTFFPEGGALIAGLESRVGFKATTHAGNGTAVEGQLLDNAGKPVGNFKADQSGTGSFLFRPQGNSVYTVKITKPQVAEGAAFALPPARLAGVTLQTTNLADSVLEVKLTGTPALANSRYELEIQSNGKVWFSESMALGAQAAAARKIGGKQMPAGLAQVRLLERGTVLAERLVYFRPQALQVTLSANKTRYGRREPVTVVVEAKDPQGKPVQGEFSVAVTDLSQNHFLSINPNIYSSLQPAAALPAAYAGYLKDNTPETRKALDDLLLTLQASEIRPVKAAPLQEAQGPGGPDQELSLQGKVVNGQGEPLGKAIVFLLELETGKSDLVTASENGTFSYPIRMPNASYRFLYQVWQQGVFQKEARVVPFADSLTAFPDMAGPALSPAGNHKLLLQAGIQKQFRETIATPAQPAGAGRNWATVPADRTYQLSNYSEFQDVEEVFKEIVPSIRIRTKQDQTESRVINPATKKFNANQPLYLIDGQPTFNGDLVLRMNADLVQEVSVFFTPEKLQPFGFIGNQGVVAIRTKAGNFRTAELSNNLLELPGLAEEKTFKILGTEASAPDFRPTLYWNPRVKTDASGRARITFPTSDAATRFGIELEGLTPEGTVGREFLEFEALPAQ